MTKQHYRISGRKTVAGAILGVALLVSAWVGVTVGGSMLATAAPQDAEEVVSEPVSKPHAVVEPEAEAVNNGTQNQAAGVTMRKVPQVDAQNLKGLGNGGCVVGYGDPGQCLPAVPPSHAAHAAHSMAGAWTCKELRTIFVDGLKVERGKDSLKLDSNNDGVACGEGDAA